MHDSGNNNCSIGFINIKVDIVRKYFRMSDANFFVANGKYLRRTRSEGYALTLHTGSAGFCVIEKSEGNPAERLYL